MFNFILESFNIYIYLLFYILGIEIKLSHEIEH